jgi:hypothetical protein
MIKKTIRLESQLLDKLVEKYPNEPFNRLVEQALQSKLQADNVVEDVLTKDVVVKLLNNMGKQIHDIHSRLKK